MKVKREDLFNASHALLVAAGESPEGAALVAETFCKADARGITTHGSYLLNPIFNRVKAGQLTLPTQATLALDNAAVAVVDGGDGLGPVAGKLAADLAVARAKQFGVGLCSSASRQRRFPGVLHGNGRPRGHDRPDEQ